MWCVYLLIGTAFHLYRVQQEMLVLIIAHIHYIFFAVQQFCTHGMNAAVRYAIGVISVCQRRASSVSGSQITQFKLVCCAHLFIPLLLPACTAEGSWHSGRHVTRQLVQHV